MKAYFHFHGYINDRNAIFGSQRIQGLFFQPTISTRDSHWCALIGVGVFGPVFLDGIVTSDVTPRMPRNELVPFLQTHHCSEHSARPLIRNARISVSMILYQHFLLPEYGLFWPSPSPYLHPFRANISIQNPKTDYCHSDKSNTVLHQLWPGFLAFLLLVFFTGLANDLTFKTSLCKKALPQVSRNVYERFVRLYSLLKLQ
jgi:hypothetical protein